MNLKNHIKIISCSSLLLLISSQFMVLTNYELSNLNATLIGLDKRISFLPPEFSQFIEAVKNNEIEKVKLLIKSGVKFDTQDSIGKTALMYSAFEDYPQIVNSLILAGANLDFRDKNGNTALILASSAGNLLIANLLIAAGANLNIKNRLGETALDLASGDIMQDFIKKNIN